MLENQLIDDAKSYGFDEAKILSIKETRNLNKELNNFLFKKHHGEMKWMAERSEIRSDQKKLWREAKSILVLASNYHFNEHSLALLNKKDSGIISVYARGRDHHLSIKKRLKVLSKWIIDNYNCNIKYFVDTAPVMEKPLAQLSGLGWQGKHTNLVSRDLGNWFFIGVMYIDKSLPVDKPEEDNCGSCTKCLDVCPTNAFVGAYKLDARKCIAYLTIEHKGAIDKEFRSSIGNRVFGCDDCLAICPWNKFAQIARNVNYRDRFSDLTLERAINFSDTEFRKFFSGTAVKRLGSTRFLRNVIYAMGNSGNKKYIIPLKSFLNYPVDYISEAASWSITELKKNV